MNDAITLRQVAEYFQVTTRTIREWMGRDSAFPRPFKKFGTLRFRRSEIEEYWSKNTINNGPFSTNFHFGGLKEYKKNIKCQKNFPQMSED
jgi:predicted DNA-binding transcriptional regulator AlpA